MLYLEYLPLLSYGLTLIFFITSLIFYNKNKSLKEKYKDITNAEKAAQLIMDMANEKHDKIILNANEEKQNILNEKEKICQELYLIKDDYKNKKEIYDKLLTEINIFEDKIEYIELGLEEIHFEFDDPEEYKIAIEDIRTRQKEMAKKKVGDGAVTCSMEWTVNGSFKEGQKFTNESIKLTLKAFNNACDVIINNVSWKNFPQSSEKIKKAFDFFNNYNKTKIIRISPQYLNLKLEELRLVYENQERKKQIKEEQRAIREQIREEERFERDRIAAEKEEEKYKKLLQKAQEEAEKASGKKLEEFQEKIEKLNELLKEAKEKNQRALSMAQQTKSGHVYIISNIGSFGNDVFKIGMTRRLDPYERVYELGDASVPFEFDVHAMIPCEDAPALESRLHKAFEKYKMNLINNRREFFKVSLDEIEKKVKEYKPDTQFIKTALAEQYNKSEALRKQRYSISEDSVKKEVFPENLQ